MRPIVPLQGSTKTFVDPLGVKKNETNDTRGKEQPSGSTKGYEFDEQRQQQQQQQKQPELPVSSTRRERLLGMVKRRRQKQKEQYSTAKEIPPVSIMKKDPKYQSKLPQDDDDDEQSDELEESLLVWESCNEVSSADCTAFNDFKCSPNDLIQETLLFKSSADCNSVCQEEQADEKRHVQQQPLPPLDSSLDTDATVELPPVSRKPSSPTTPGEEWQEYFTASIKTVYETASKSMFVCLTPTNAITDDMGAIDANNSSLVEENEEEIFNDLKYDFANPEINDR